jgi:hypothetical protein
MDIFVEVDTFFIRANKVWHFYVEITNFQKPFKPWINYKFWFPTVQENCKQQKSDQIMILHLYITFQMCFNNAIKGEYTNFL